MAVDRGFIKEVRDLIAKWNGAQCKGEREEQEEGKYILDCAAYPYFTNRSSPYDGKFTEMKPANSAKGQFKPTKRTKIRVEKKSRTINVTYLRHDALKEKNAIDT